MQDPEWPVQIFRKSDTYGWQQLEARCSLVKKASSKKTTAGSKSSAASRGKTSKKATASAVQNATTTKRVKLSASPRAGSIVVRILRLRISIHPDTTVMTRRRNTILIESSQGARVFLLRFADVPSCLAFSDHFVRLNPMKMMMRQQQQKLQQPNNKKLPPPTAARSNVSPRSSIDATQSTPKIQNKSKKKTATTAQKKQVAQSSMPAPRGVGVSSSSRERQQVMSYIYRLLQSPDFLEYTNRLEATLKSAPEGMQMIHDLLGKQDESDSR